MMHKDYFKPPSILSKDPLVKALNLQRGWKSEFEPIIDKKYMYDHYFQFLDGIYVMDHEELDVIGNVFPDIGGVGGFRGAEDGKLPAYLLALDPTVDNILHTQEMVKELGTNDELFTTVHQLLKIETIYHQAYREDQLGIVQRVNMSPERAEFFLKQLTKLHKHKPTSQGFQELIAWANGIRSDQLYTDILEEKELAKQNRIIMIAKPEFGDGILYGRLKKGVQVDDIMDLYTERDGEFVNYPVQKESDYFPELFVQYTNGEAKAVNEQIVLSSRQNLNAVNKKTAELLTAPLYSSIIQLYHVLAGANMYRYLKEEGHPITFPQIIDEPGIINAKGILPTRIILSRIGNERNKKRNRGPVYGGGEMESTLYDIDFTVDTPFTQIEGPNDNGKTELMRTLFLNTHLATKGFPVAANEYQTYLYKAAHFFKFKKTPGTGGSELEKDMNYLMYELAGTSPEDLIVIDEVGDATNDATATEFVNRLFPALQERNNTTIFTSHQRGLGAITEKYGGKVYRPTARSKNPYQPMLADGEPDYMPNEVLDKLGVTTDFIAGKLPKQRLTYKQTVSTKPKEGDDLPF